MVLISVIRTCWMLGLVVYRLVVRRPNKVNGWHGQIGQHSVSCVNRYNNFQQSRNTFDEYLPSQHSGNSWPANKAANPPPAGQATCPPYHLTPWASPGAEEVPEMDLWTQ